MQENTQPEEPGTTERDLVYDVARCALEVRRVERRLRAFNAGPRASNALIAPMADFDAAVERLAVFRGAQ